MPASEELYIAMMCLIGFSFEYLRDTFDILIGNLKEIKLNDIFVNAFLFIAWLKNWVEVNAKYLYDTYPFIRKNTDKVCYAIDYCNAHFTGYRIEPLCDSWISLTTLDKSNNELFVGDKYVCSEQYYFFKSDSTLSINDIYKQGIEHVSEIAKSRYSSATRETMITMKVSDKYLCSSLFNTETHTLPAYTLSSTKGRNYFLSIEYTHPRMSSGIVMDMPTNVYNANSDILTPAFIKRYLEYQSLPYVFDMRYTLKMLDTNINMFNMKSNQYIKIKDRSYDVVTVGTVDDEDVSEVDNDDNGIDDIDDIDNLDSEDSPKNEDSEVVEDSPEKDDNEVVNNSPENEDSEVVINSPENEDAEKELSEVEETEPTLLENEDTLESNEKVIVTE